ncbi:MAG: GTPase [Planctomycetota bacterium]|jgi:tRNA modification GTPase
MRRTKDKKSNAEAFAAVMTGKGTGPIATILVWGGSAETVIKNIFVPAGDKSKPFTAGNILVGRIIDSNETIDQVAIGCEDIKTFAIHYHGNPLIGADIMKLLKKNNVTLLSAEQMLTKTLSVQKNSIETEAKLACIKAKTISGAKLIASQIDAGLVKTASQWLADIKKTSLERIKAEAEQLLADSKIAKLLIYGCRVAIAGPPNTGKSSLLNRLAGRQKAIVTHIKGTTRDYVTTACLFGRLLVELFDTAGLDKSLAQDTEAIEKIAQQKSIEILSQADLVILVLDNSQSENKIDITLAKKIAAKKVLTLLNKSDLPARFEAALLPKNLTNTVKISAKTGDGIETLKEKTQTLAGLGHFNLKTPVCFTPRQQRLVKKLCKANSKSTASAIITELLNGPFRV